MANERSLGTWVGQGLTHADAQAPDCLRHGSLAFRGRQVEPDEHPEPDHEGSRGAPRRPPAECVRLFAPWPCRHPGRRDSKAAASCSRTKTDTAEDSEKQADSRDSTIGLHARLHQPTGPYTPSRVTAGLAALLHSLSEADNRTLARLLPTGEGPRDGSLDGPSASPAESRGG
jgi:hypothetical protein